jgi:energy-coupling factor transport system substrate-specific component
VSPTVVRVTAGLVAAGLAALAGLATLAGLEEEQALRVAGLVAVLAVAAGLGMYALVEYVQTRRLHSLARQFDTRTLVLMPVAMAMNIVLGTAVASALKVPIYLDSLGTILVAALAGPLAGALTGLLTNLVWTYLAPPPFGSPYAAPFAIVAVVIGLMAGTFARLGWLRPRPHSSGPRLALGAIVTIGLLALMAVLALRVWEVAARGPQLAPTSDEAAFAILGWVAMLLVVGTAIGLVVRLVRDRDLAVAYVVVAGACTGIVAAFIAAPIAAGLFGGVTGSGADFVIAALRQAGADLEAAVLGQSLVSDSIDKVVTYFVVFVILGTLADRTKARFPQGDRLLALAPGASGPPGAPEATLALDATLAPDATDRPT